MILVRNFFPVILCPGSKVSAEGIFQIQENQQSRCYMYQFSVDQTKSGTKQRTNQSAPPMSQLLPFLYSAATFAILLLATLPTAVAFTVPPPPHASSCRYQACVPRRTMTLSMSSSTNNVNPDSSKRMRIFGALGLAFAVLISNDLQPAMAITVTGTNTEFPSAITTAATMVDHTRIESYGSSTLHLSEAIKTMEFSLPSSYDSIADAKSAATDELTVTATVNTNKGKSSGAKSGKQPAAPTMTSEERAAFKEARDAQKQAEEAARAAARAADKEAAEAAAQAKREAAAALRDLEKEQKAQAAKLKKEAAAEKRGGGGGSSAAISSGVEFVDMGLPSYSDAARTEGKKSAFSL